MTEEKKTWNIGIVGGTGREGRGLAMRWARAGHSVTIGSRSAERAAERAAALSEVVGVPIAGGTNEAVAAEAELVCLTIPYGGHGETLAALKDALHGKIVIDITVPLKPPKVRRVHLPEGKAACIEAQTILGEETKVVATLHHVSSAHLEDPNHEIDCDVLVCSDDRPARQVGIELVRDLGLRAIDAGVLDNAVALESLTPVLIHINKRYKVEGGAGLRITGLADDA
jgi:NADPH-dependent F420 reductase